MKTTIKRIKHIEFTKNELSILKKLGMKEPLRELALDEDHAQKLINILIDINPTKQEHKDFIMQLIKELKI